MNKQLIKDKQLLNLRTMGLNLISNILKTTIKQLYIDYLIQFQDKKTIIENDQNYIIINLSFNYYTSKLDIEKCLFDIKYNDSRIKITYQNNKILEEKEFNKFNKFDKFLINQRKQLIIFETTNKILSYNRIKNLKFITYKKNDYNIVVIYNLNKYVSYNININVNSNKNYNYNKKWSAYYYKKYNIYILLKKSPYNTYYSNINHYYSSILLYNNKFYYFYCLT